MFHRNLRGNDLHAPSNELVENNTGASIPVLTVVKFNGWGTTFPQVEPVANPSDSVGGVTQAPIAAGQAGYICALGFLFNVDTSAWAVNTVLYGSSTGQLSTTPFGFPVAQVMKQDATYGVLYIDNTLGLNASVLASAWFTTGNIGTNPATDFLGNADNTPLRFRTNNDHRMTIDQNGLFGFGPDILQPLDFMHIKAHTGYPGSGKRVNTFAVSTNDPNMDPAYAFQVPINSTVLMTVSVAGRQEDGNAHGAFKRSLCVYREGMQAVLQGGVQSDFTQCAAGMNVGFTINMDTIQLNVQNSSGQSTNWSGHVEIEVIS